MFLLREEWPSAQAARKSSAASRNSSRTHTDLWCLTRTRITGTPTLFAAGLVVIFRPRSHEITGRMLRVCRPGDLLSQCWFSHSLIMRRPAAQWCSLIIWWITLISALPADTLHSNKTHYLTSNLNTSWPRWPQKPWQIFTCSMCYRLTQSAGTFPSGKGTGMSGLMFGCCVDLLCRQLETSDSGCLNLCLHTCIISWIKNRFMHQHPGTLGKNNRKTRAHRKTRCHHIVKTFASTWLSRKLIEKKSAFGIIDYSYSLMSLQGFWRRNYSFVLLTLQASGAWKLGAYLFPDMGLKLK